MSVYLVVVDDDLAALLGITCDIGDGYGQFNFKMEFNGSSQDKIIAKVMCQKLIN